MQLESLVRKFINFSWKLFSFSMIWRSGKNGQETFLIFFWNQVLVSEKKVSIISKNTFRMEIIQGKTNLRVGSSADFDSQIYGS